MKHSKQVNKSRRNIRIALFTGFALVALVSATFQSIAFTQPPQSANGDHIIAPDSVSYLTLARKIGLPESESVSYYRLPGFAMTIRALAALNGIPLDQVQWVPGDWDANSPSGKQLARSVLLLNRALGFLIPVLIYLAIFVITRSAWMSAIVSGAYMLDLSVVAYQNAVLTQLPALFLFTVHILCAASLLYRGGIPYAIGCGLSLAALLLVRPEFALLPALLASLIALQWVGTRGSWKRAALAVAAVLGIPGIAALGWAAHNGIVHGHYTYSQGTAYTLPNFAARHFITIETNDPELVMLQTISRARIRENDHFIAFRIARDAKAHLHLDQYEFNRLLNKASWFTIRKFPGEFLAGAAARAWLAWERPFENVPTIEVHENLGRRPVWNYFVRLDGRMLLGRLSLFGFLICCGVLWLLAIRLPDKLMLAYAAVAVLTGFVFCTMVDEVEFLRHTMQYRVVVNAIGLLTIVCVLADVARRRRSAKAKARRNNGADLSSPA